MQKMEVNDGGGENTNTDHRYIFCASQQSTQKGSGGSFLDSTSASTCSKKSLHSSRLTLSDSKEFYRTAGCRWIRAVRKGDAKKVKKMLEDKPELANYAPNYGPLPLHMATARFDKSIIMLLLAKGADVDARDASGYTSLQLAIRLGKQSLAHFLISQGANLELIDPDGLHITDYDEWSGEDQSSAEKFVYGKQMLRPKSHSFVNSSPSSISVKSSGSNRPIRPSSTPDHSMMSEIHQNELKRDTKRSSWKSIFELKPLRKRFGSFSKS